MIHIGALEDRSDDGCPFGMERVLVELEGLELCEVTKPRWKGYKAISANYKVSLNQR